MTSETSHYNKADTNLYHAIHSDLVGELLHPPRAPSTPEEVRRFRRAHYAEPGLRTYHWGVANDPNDKPDQVHGTKFGTKSLAGEVVSPPVVPRPHRLLAAARRLTYDSTVRRPVGCVPLHQPAVPPHLSCAGAATFGTPTKYGHTVAQCVSPFRNAKDFQASWCKGTDLYRRSHQHLNPGEQVHRSYGRSFDKKTKFGVPTYSSENHTGRRVKECVTGSPGGCQLPPAICSLRAQTWRQLNQDRVGETLNKYQCTRDLPADFTYGTPMRHVLSGALDIATARTGCSLPAEELAKLDLILATRRRLQAAGFTGFIALLQTMKKMDKLGTKHLPLESVLVACRQQCVPLSANELRRLVERLNLVHGPRQVVIYSLLVATLNWKDRLTLGHLDLLRKDRRPVAECRTSTACQFPPPPPDWKIEHKRSSGYGEPPQRDEGPRRDRVVDVVTPSPFIEAGLRETELTMPRSEAFLLELLCGMGVCDYRQFQTLYAAAKARHPPAPSVLDILHMANTSCCGKVEAPVEKPHVSEADSRLCAAGLEEVKAVTESRTCRGTEQLTIIPPSLDGEKKVRFDEPALEATGKRPPKTDPGCNAEFLDQMLEDGRPTCQPETGLTFGFCNQCCQRQWSIQQPSQQLCAHQPPSNQPCANQPKSQQSCVHQSTLNQSCSNQSPDQPVMNELPAQQSCAECYPSLQ